MPVTIKLTATMNNDPDKGDRDPVNRGNEQIRFMREASVRVKIAYKCQVRLNLFSTSKDIFELSQP